jgi:radical SAM superfamily enzyme YgiQ (UPF0313 family)
MINEVGELRPVEKEAWIKRHQKYRVLASRGCPYQCAYCWNSMQDKFQRKVRKKSVEYFIRQLKHIKEQLPDIKEFSISDDSFLSYSVESLIEFSQLYKKEIGIPFQVSGASPSLVRHEKIAPLVDAGLCSISIGIESGNENGLKIFNRKMTNKQVMRAATIINSYDVAALYHIIIDVPWETEEDVKDTLRFLRQFPTPYTFTAPSLCYFPGTPLYERALSEGIIEGTHEELSTQSFVTDSGAPLNPIFRSWGKLCNNNAIISSITLEILMHPLVSRAFGYKSMIRIFFQTRKLFSLRFWKRWYWSMG